MQSPHMPRPEGGLPKRLPGSGNQISASSAPPHHDATTGEDPDRTTAPVEASQPGETSDQATPLPRLAQISSLGPRANAGGSLGTRRQADDFAEDRTRPGKHTRGLFRQGDDKARRDGFRGALGVVGVVGALSAIAVALTLGLGGQDEDDRRDRGAMVVDTGDHALDDIAGPGGAGIPSASVSGGGHSAAPPRSAKPSPTVSPGDHTTPKAPAASDKPSGVQAPGAVSSSESAPTPVPGVGVFSHASQRCIDVVGGRAVPGAGLMIWDCSGSASQHWTFPSDGTMRSGGLCMELVGGSTADGADLRMASCNGGAAQEISLNFHHDVVSELANKCVDVRDSLTANGTGLQLWSCNGHDNQKWSTS